MKCYNVCTSLFFVEVIYIWDFVKSENSLDSYVCGKKKKKLLEELEFDVQCVLIKYFVVLRDPKMEKKKIPLEWSQWMFHYILH